MSEVTTSPPTRRSSGEVNGSATDFIGRLWAEVASIDPQEYPVCMTVVPAPLNQRGWFPVETGLDADRDGNPPLNSRWVG